jgi:hypothetical protein
LKSTYGWESIGPTKDFGTATLFVVSLHYLCNGTTRAEVPKFKVHSKREISLKRDIVDTFFHASRAFGHAPTLGLAFSLTWGMESKD